MEDTNTDESVGLKNVRDALDREKERTAQLEAQIKNQAFQLAGLDPEKGPGALVAKAYDGEMDATSIREFATEHGINLEGATGETLPVATQEQLAAQAQADALSAVATPAVPPADPEAERLKQAARDGDVQASIALKLNQAFNQ